MPHRVFYGIPTYNPGDNSMCNIVSNDKMYLDTATFFHFAAEKRLLDAMLDSGCIAIAYETVQDDKKRLPLLVPMSEVAGRMATQVGAMCLQKDKGGKGLLLGGVPGVHRAKVTVIGCGIAGTNATKMAMGLGADVTCIDLNTKRLAEMDDLFDNRITTLFSNTQNIEEAVINSDLVIGAVLVPGAKAPKLVTKDMISKMENGSVVVDIAVDQGGCIETCKPTTHQNPTFEVDGVVHYCVANMPGGVARTATLALTNATLPYVIALADQGIDAALANDAHLMNGLNVHNGMVTVEAVAEALAYDYVHPEIAMAGDVIRLSV